MTHTESIRITLTIASVNCQVSTLSHKTSLQVKRWGYFSNQKRHLHNIWGISYFCETIFQNLKYFVGHMNIHKKLKKYNKTPNISKSCLLLQICRVRQSNYQGKQVVFHIVFCIWMTHSCIHFSDWWGNTGTGFYWIKDQNVILYCP